MSPAIALLVALVHEAARCLAIREALAGGVTRSGQEERCSEDGAASLHYAPTRAELLVWSCSSRASSEASIDLRARRCSGRHRLGFRRRRRRRFVRGGRRVRDRPRGCPSARAADVDVVGGGVAVEVDAGSSTAGGSFVAVVSAGAGSSAVAVAVAPSPSSPSSSSSSPRSVAVAVAVVVAEGGSTRRALVDLPSFATAVTMRIAPITPAATETPRAAAAKYRRRRGPSSAMGAWGRYSMFAEPSVAELGTSPRPIGPLALLGADGASPWESGTRFRPLDGAAGY